MKIPNLSLLGILGFLILTSTSSAFAGPDSADLVDKSNQSCGDKALRDPPVGYIFIERSEFADINAFPLDLLADARAEFRAGNPSVAALDIRSAAKFMKIQAGGDPENRQLEETASNLENLSKKVSRQEIKSLAALDSELAKSANAEAEHHYLHATAAWARHMSRNVGADLTSAVKAVQRSAEWSGRKIVLGENDIISESEKLSKKLVAGGEWTSDEVGKGLASLGTEISLLGKKLEPSAKDTK